MKKGDSSDAVLLIKQKLFELGDLATKDSSQVFDSSLLVASKHYQKRMGLSIDGSIGNKMIQSLNIPIAKRIEQILVNMERLRWMPPQTIAIISWLIFQSIDCTCLIVVRT